MKYIYIKDVGDSVTVTTTAESVYKNLANAGLVVSAPDGYEFTGEFRQPRKDEWFMSPGGLALFNTISVERPRFILKVLKKKRVSFTFDRRDFAKPGEWYLRNDDSFYKAYADHRDKSDIYIRKEEEV